MRQKDNATKKKGKPKALGFFEYDDIPDSFLVSSGSNSSHESDAENCNPNRFPKAPKVKTKTKHHVDPPDDGCSSVKPVKTKGKPKSSKRFPSKVVKTIEEEENFPIQTKKRRKLAPSSREVASACRLPTRKTRHAKIQDASAKTKETVKGKPKRRVILDENSETEKGLAAGFSPSKLRGQQTSTPAPNKTDDRRKKQPLKSLSNILSPLPIVKAPSPVDFDDSFNKSDRFGKSYTRESMSGLKLKRKRRQKKIVVPGFFDDDDDTEEKEEELAVACPAKKPKKMTQKQQKEERYAKWVVEINAEFSDIEQHELCVEST